ncbi:MAG: hypothetical protein K6E62_13690 [Lachnospiraceae bacterium]|nr:hypothetical protein [Lachnospiraceae bacterium]
MMKSRTIFIFLAAAVLTVSFLTGCSKETKDPGITEVTPTAMGDTGPTQGGKNTTTPTPTAVAGEDTPAIQPTPTGSEQAPDKENEPVVSPAPVEDPVTPSGTESPETDGDGNDAAKEPDGQDAEENGTDVDPVIEEYWTGSFLIWLPQIGKGSFKDFGSDETHDFIILENITEKNVKSYIKKLTKNGFTTDRVYLSENGEVLPDKDDITGGFGYRASNDDGWSAQLAYDPESGTLTVTSGYDIEEEADAYDLLRAETPLGLLPGFTFGTFDSSKQDGEMYYAIFSNVEGDYAGYTELLKEAGFTLEADEGDSDGIIWYYAYNEDGYFCEFNYTDGMARIGCGTD